MVLKLNFPALARLKRSAQAFPNGPAIFELILANKPALVTAADEGLPPVSSISAELKRRFAADVALSPVRQFIGSVIKAVLVDAGYEVHQTGVRLPRDPVFTTGSIYRKSATKLDKETEAVRAAYAAMVKGMTPRQRRLMFDVLKLALGEA